MTVIRLPVVRVRSPRRVTPSSGRALSGESKDAADWLLAVRLTFPSPCAVTYIKKIVFPNLSVTQDKRILLVSLD